MLEERTYQHRNFIGNKIAEMILNDKFDLLCRSVYVSAPIYSEMKKYSLAEFVNKYSLYTIDIGKCVSKYSNITGNKIPFKITKDKLTIGKTSRFRIYDEYYLIQAYNYCVENDLVSRKKYVSLKEFLSFIGVKGQTNAWNERIKNIKKGFKEGSKSKLVGLKLRSIVDDTLEGDSKKTASYLYHLDDLTAIHERFQS
jgi:hypothetical protein